MNTEKNFDRTNLNMVADVMFFYLEHYKCEQSTHEALEKRM